MKPSRRAASASRVYPSGILHRPVDRVAGPHAGLGRGQAHGELHAVHGPGVRPIDAERLEQIAQAELQADHAPMGARDLDGEPQAARRLDIDKKADGLRDPSPGLAPGEHGGRGPHVLRGLRLGHVDHVHAGPGHGGHVRFEVRGSQSVHPHDEDLAAGPRGRLLQERFQRPSRLALSALLDGVLQVEGDRVGLTGQRLVEELRARSGHEQLAAHEEIHRPSPDPPIGFAALSADRIRFPAPDAPISLAPREIRDARLAPRRNLLSIDSKRYALLWIPEGAIRHTQWPAPRRDPFLALGTRPGRWEQPSPYASIHVSRGPHPPGPDRVRDDTPDSRLC